MTSRNNETKQESVSISWSSLPSAEEKAKEDAFNFYWSSLPREQSPREKAYSFSWSTQPPDPSPVPPQPESVAAAQGNPAPAGTAKAHPSGSALGVFQGITGQIFTRGPPSVRILGLIGWSAIAGSGAVVALADASPSIATQLGSIGGLWLGVSAAIWFLPKVVRSSPDGSPSAVR